MKLVYGSLPHIVGFFFALHSTTFNNKKIGKNLSQKYGIFLCALDVAIWPKPAVQLLQIRKVLHRVHSTGQFYNHVIVYLLLQGVGGF